MKLFEVRRKLVTHINLAACSVLRDGHLSELSVTKQEPVQKCDVIVSHELM